MPQFGQITPAAAFRLIGLPDVPHIFDVRLPEDIAALPPAARFLFVAPTEVAEVASRLDAIPFDIEGVPLSHRGPRCSFDALLDDYGLHGEALDRMATVIRAADTDRHDLSPQAAGLLALSVGLSRMFRDDLQQLEAALGLFDALYRWARDAHEEGHDWPAGRTA
jgi:hypothetical protein